MTQKLKLLYVEFYLTNACNLNCQGCNSISNFNVAGGVQLWQDYKDVYTEWAKRLDISCISLMGGEPLLNPDYKNWISGVRKLWPCADFTIATNGTTFDKNQQDLYNLCREYNVNVAVTIHNRHSVDHITNNLKDWLVAPLTIGKPTSGSTIVLHNDIVSDPLIQQRLQKNLKDCQDSYNIIKDPSWPECTSLEDWYGLDIAIRQECEQQHNFTFEILLHDTDTEEFLITDVNNVTVIIRKQFHLTQGIIEANVNKNQFEFNQSDPAKAFAVCFQSTCPQFYQGKLHKCAPSHVFKDVVKQFNTDLSQSDLDLINGYSPVGVNASDNAVLEFIEGLKREIPQCKFCPEQLKMVETLSDSRKTIQIKRLSH